MKHQKKAAPNYTPEELLLQLHGALSMCRKAGKLVMGYDPVVEAVMAGKTDCVYLASDISPKTAQRLRYAVEDMAEVLPLPLTQDDLADVTRKRVAVYAVIDTNLARLCETKRKQCEHLIQKEEASE